MNVTPAFNLRFSFFIPSESIYLQIYPLILTDIHILFMKRLLIVILYSVASFVPLSAQILIPDLLAPYKNETDCRNWVDSVYNAMSLDERIGQLFMKVVSPELSELNMNEIQTLITDNHIGGVLFQKGDAEAQAAVTNFAQSCAKLPLLVALDGEWGLSMRLANTIQFPKNMTLGAIHNDSLLYCYGKEVGRECREMGIHVNFAPVADVNSNPGNPVIGNRSFGEIPENVASNCIAYFKGLQSQGVIAVGKHFPGHGDTSTDSHEELPVVDHKKKRLHDVELYPFRAIIESGIDGMMSGHLYVPALDTTFQPASLSPKVVDGLLKESLQFGGLIFTDALVMKGVSSSENLCVRALLAGNDVLLDPDNIGMQMQQVKEALNQGIISRTMLEDKLMKILTYKYIVGLNEYKPILLENLKERLNPLSAQSLNSTLHRRSITVVKNDSDHLPLHQVATSPIASLSIGADSKTSFQAHLQAYSPMVCLTTSSAMSKKESDKWRTTLKDFPQLIVSIHSSRAAENQALVELCKMHQVTLVFFVSPYTMSNFSESITYAKSVVMAYENSAEMQQSAAEAVCGGLDVQGKLPVTVTDLFSEGTGLTLRKSRISYSRPMDIGVSYEALDEIEAVVKEGLAEKAYPGCQVMVVKNGYVIYDRAFGSFDYAQTHPVEISDSYDLASLTKTTATLPAVMKLYDQQKIRLSDKVSSYLPFLLHTDKENLTISDLLYHESGLTPFLPFYEKLIDKDSYKGPLLARKQDNIYTLPFDGTYFANKNFMYEKSLVSAVKKPKYTIQMAEGMYLSDSFRDTVMQEIVRSPLGSLHTYQYSDLNFILLKELVEVVTKESFDTYIDRTLYRPLGAAKMGFHPLTRMPKQSIVPTVDDQFLRKQLLVGYPHDEAAAVLGGVAGNAGLFSNANDIAKYLQMLLNQGTYGGDRFLSAETVRLFTESKSDYSRRGLGFDKSVQGDSKLSPVCDAASKTEDVYGHTGFTGTCYWVDPHQQLIYIFLSNRVHPSRGNNKLSTLSIRSRIHEVIYKALGVE